MAAWYLFTPSSRQDASHVPSARECHSMNLLVTEDAERLVVFGGNDSAVRMNDVLTLDAREACCVS